MSNRSPCHDSMFEDSDEGAPHGDEAWISLLGGSKQSFQEPTSENTDEVSACSNGDNNGLHLSLPGHIRNQISLFQLGELELAVSPCKSCCVCTQKYHKDETLCSLRCGHLFHEPCIYTWLNGHFNCPFCSYRLASDVHDTNQPIQSNLPLSANNASPAHIDPETPIEGTAFAVVETVLSDEAPQSEEAEERIQNSTPIMGLALDGEQRYNLSAQSIGSESHFTQFTSTQRGVESDFRIPNSSFAQPMSNQHDGVENGYHRPSTFCFGEQEANFANNTVRMENSAPRSMWTNEIHNAEQEFPRREGEGLWSNGMFHSRANQDWLSVTTTAAAGASFEEAQPQRSPRASESYIRSLPELTITKGSLVHYANHKCGICTDDFLLRDVINWLPCTHIFHRKCIHPWLANHCSCPICRCSLPTDDEEWDKHQVECKRDEKQADAHEELEKMGLYDVQRSMPETSYFQSPEEHDVRNPLNRNGIIDMTSISNLAENLAYGPEVTATRTHQFESSGRSINDQSPEVSSVPSIPSTQDYPTSSGSRNLQIKNDLYRWLNQEQRVYISKENYLTWDNGGECHQKLFSSIFIHPSGQLFPSGRIGDFFIEPVEPGIIPTVWFHNKKAAENGAAARAYDCLRYRQALETGQQFEKVCSEEPSVYSLSLPHFLPPDICQAISDFQARLT